MVLNKEMLRISLEVDLVVVLLPINWNKSFPIRIKVILSFYYCTIFINKIVIFRTNSACLRSLILEPNPQLLFPQFL